LSLIREKEFEVLQRSYLLFECGLNSPESKKTYKKNLNNFMKFAGYVNRYDEFIQLDTNTIQTHLENFLLFHRSRVVKGRTIRNYLTAIELLLDVNKVTYFKKALHLLIPKDNVKQGGDVPFTDDDIRKMISSTTSKRNIALIHFFASVGGRPGVLYDPVLSFKNVYPMPNGSKALLLYSDSKEEYCAFLTPEASRFLDDYRDERIRKGERMTLDSPVFITNENYRHGRAGENYIRSGSLHQIFQVILKNSGVERVKIGCRFDKALLYGFRKRFNTILKLDNDINSNIAEKLMAHKNGLDGTYLKPTKEQCFTEFVKAVPALTLDKSEMLQMKLEEIEKHRDDKIAVLEGEVKAIYKLLERGSV